MDTICPNLPKHKKIPTKTAHFEPNFKRKFWGRHSTLPRPFPGERETPHSQHATLPTVSSVPRTLCLWHSPFLHKILNTPLVMGITCVLQRFKTAIMTFSLTQGHCHCQSCHSMSHRLRDFLLHFHCNYVSNLHHFQDIIDYFPKFKEVT